MKLRDIKHKKKIIFIGDGTVGENDTSGIGSELGKGNMNNKEETRQ